MKQKDTQVRKRATAGEVFARRVREVRESRGWRQQTLADRLAELGYPIHRATLAKIEAGRTRARNVSIEEVLAIARALDVAPLHMVVSLDPDEGLAISETYTMAPVLARRWIRGRDPVGADKRTYLTQQPLEELEAGLALADRVDESGVVAPPSPALARRRKERS